MSRRSRHAGFSSRRTAPWLRTAALGVALLSAWLGLASQTPRDTPQANGHVLNAIERPVGHAETCLSRSSREPTHLEPRRTHERTASDPPRFHAAVQQRPDELPPPAAIGRTRVARCARDASRAILPRLARGPPLAPRA
jgi:hypothetical protein